MEFLVCDECGTELSIQGFPETVTCPVCEAEYHSVILPSLPEWLKENWVYVALGFAGVAVMYMTL